MHPSIQPVAEQLRITTNLFTKAMTGVSPEDAWRRPADRSNPLLWMAGHVTQFRCRLLGLLGVQHAYRWGATFDTGSKIASPDSYPTPAEIIEEWDELSRLLMERLATLTDAELDAVPRSRVPSTDGTVRGIIGFFSLHEAYHVGQMGYVRKWLGLTPLIDPPRAEARTASS